MAGMIQDSYILVIQKHLPKKEGKRHWVLMRKEGKRSLGKAKKRASSRRRTNSVSQKVTS